MALIRDSFANVLVGIAQLLDGLDPEQHVFVRLGLEEEGVTVVRLQTEDTATLGVVVSDINERRLGRDWRFLAKYRVLSNKTTTSSVSNILAHVSGHVVHYGFNTYSACAVAMKEERVTSKHRPHRSPRPITRLLQKINNLLHHNMHPCESTTTIWC